ncbi:3-keto-disaccharide hydrolase [Fulvivirga sedimenti]|uniref:DUF1080 domain-containing protein n=1 Tax=Fulvivirga sedimenti TaxID=2879465 RepID=A0A9X1L213_9BACT|nr:DUF1080 domain-containing protein [Fulvivirga sedimenti]MCA6078827.1 DUF1080 domain-containing protein [Fulvivirga sedimenti]
MKYILVCLVLLSCKSYQPLFNETANNWREYGDAEWTFSNGEIIGISNNTDGFLMTSDTYEDFILEMEFYPDDSINSGIFIRCKESVLSYTDCYEINIWDLHPNQEYRTGSIVARFTPLATVHTNNQWNSYKIEVRKDHIRVWVNKRLTADLVDDALSEGFIALQSHGKGKIRFRNVRLKSL